MPRNQRILDELHEFPEKCENVINFGTNITFGINILLIIKLLISFW